jgi:hypothetical protein
VTAAAASSWRMGVPGDTQSSSAGATAEAAEACGAAADAIVAVSISNGSRQCIEGLNDLCVVCRVGGRGVGLVHGDEMCLCICRGCAAAYGCGSACPMCGQLVQEQLEI